MLNRFVIALNHVKIADETKENKGTENKLSIQEVNQLMDRVRKYPRERISKEKLFSCGFSVN